MNFDLTEEQLVLQKSVRELCDRLIIPNAAKWDREERFPHEIIPPMGEMGLFGMQIPEEYGGAGMKFLDYVIALEEVAHADASVGLTMASHNSLCTGHLFLAGNEEQRRKYLPRLACGQALGGWGLTEPGSGSDAGAARARAVRNGDGWLLQRHEDVHHAGLGRRDLRRPRLDGAREAAKGLTAFIVERGTPGFRTGKRIEKMGLHASDTTELVFEDVEVPDEQRLGEIEPGLLRHAADPRQGAHRHRRLGGRHRPRRARGRAPLRQGARAVRQADRRIPGDPAHARRHGDRARRRAAAGLAGGAACRTSSQRTTQRVVDREVLRRARRCAPATRPSRSTAATATRASSTSSATCATPSSAEIGEGTNEVQKMVIAREILKEAAGA